jgi:hypothetical protein
MSPRLTELPASLLKHAEPPAGRFARMDSSRMPRDRLPDVEGTLVKVRPPGSLITKLTRG